MRIQGSSGLPPQTQQRGDYTVQQGDTLASLASKFRTTPEALAKLNNLPLEAALLPGQKMTTQIPPFMAIPQQQMMQMVPGQVSTSKGMASVQHQLESAKSTQDPLIKQYPKTGMMQMVENPTTQMVENPTTKGIASVQDQFESVKSILDPLIKQSPVDPLKK